MKKTIKIAMLLILSGVILCGCSSGKSNTNIKQAYTSIEELDYKGALYLLGEARNEGEDIRLISRAEGIAYLGLCQYPEAISSFEESLASSKGIISNIDYDINYYLAMAYAKNNQLDDAINVYDAILALKPKQVQAIYLRGIVYSMKGEIDAALENFDAAIALSPEDYDMMIQIYSALADKGYKEAGVKYLQTAMERGTKKMTNYEKGQISFYLGDYESARTYLENAKDEKGYEAVLFLGKTYEILGDINYAISVYSTYNSSNNPSAEVLNQLGLCKMKMNDYEGALSAFSQAMNISDSSIMQSLKFNEIVAYEYVGDFKKACVLMENYLAQYPDDAKAKREYQFLKTR